MFRCEPKIKHFGDNWKSLHNLQWYKQVIEKQTNVGNKMDETQDEYECMAVPEADHEELILMNIN